MQWLKNYRKFEKFVFVIKIRIHESLLLGLVENSWLKVHECRFENLPISLSSYENNMLKISTLKHLIF